MKIMQQYNIKHQVNLNMKQLEQNSDLPPLKDRALVPSMISAKRAPQLSPVGSLTNLLTEISSTGFRRQSQGHVVLDHLDKNREIPLILAKEHASRQHK